ncbi:DUF397 domain-containing protein [Spirillospora sp. NPDC048911]|uniref:DUF397 domain-containing protein n=1 Tax=Spirillospora sp. NPDC048911 TaxID=3364527 RepID=UPI003717162F
MIEFDLSSANWRKSSHSSGSAEGTCVEVAAVWRKSSHSGGTEGTCVEVAAVDRVIATRDSTDPDGPVLAFTQAEWAAFLTRVKAL